jgi:hypothetical protein
LGMSELSRPRNQVAADWKPDPARTRKGCTPPVDPNSKRRDRTALPRPTR